MVGRPEKPDFIVDARGNVEDVRRHKVGSSSAGASQPPLVTLTQPGANPSQKFASFQSSGGAAFALPVIFIILLISVGSLALYAVQTNQANFNSFYNEANRLYLAGNYTQAVEKYSRAIQINANFGQAYNNRGLAYQQLGEYDRALADANQAARLQPNSATAYNNRGLAHLALAAYDEAVADFDRALEIFPDFSKARYNRGLAYYALGQYQHSVDDFSKAIETAGLIPVTAQTPPVNDPFGLGKYIDAFSYAVDLAEAYDCRGSAYYALGEINLAIVDFNQAIQFQPDRSSAFYNRGLAFYARQDPDLAAADFDTVLALDNDPAAQQAASEMLEAMGAK